jgi:coenzyme Q-binding protein COQ10
MPGAQQSIIIDTPMDHFFSVITDFDSYADFLSEVRTTRVISDDGVRARVHYSIELIKKVEYELEFTRHENSSLTWTLASGKFMKSNEGSWNLKALNDTQTEATYTVDVAARVFVPKAVVNMLVGSTLPATLKQFKSEAEKRYNG